MPNISTRYSKTNKETSMYSKKITQPYTQNGIYSTYQLQIADLKHY